jgi:hypothetical protein
LTVSLAEVERKWIAPVGFYEETLNDPQTHVIAYLPETDRAAWHRHWDGGSADPYSFRYQHDDLMQEFYPHLDPYSIIPSRGYWVPDEGILALYPSHHEMIEHPQPLSHYQRIADQMGIAEKVDIVGALGGGIPTWEKGGWNENPLDWTDFPRKPYIYIPPITFYREVIGLDEAKDDQFVVILDVVRDKVLYHPRMYLPEDGTEELVGTRYMHDSLWGHYANKVKWESPQERHDAYGGRVRGYWIPDRGMLALYKDDDYEAHDIEVYKRIIEGLDLDEEEIDELAVIGYKE